MSRRLQRAKRFTMCEHENIDEGSRIWLARARGNLALAKTTMATGIFWEDL